jgi:glycosyltransferase involved in cell wall biosynthesis
MMPRPSVLVMAEAANPEWVSVPLVGWSMATALREVADVHIVTQVRNREAILRAGLVEGRDFTAIDTEALAAPMYRLATLLRMGSGKGWTMTTALEGLVYPYFERKVWQRFGADIRGGRFDIVHRVTPVTPTAVSPIAAKCAAAGVPFVMGPINGGVPWPRGFDDARMQEREWLSYVRGLYKLKPGRGRMFASTAAVIAGSRHTASEMPSTVSDRLIWLPENAIDPARFNMVSPQDISGPIRGCFIGRLVPYKGPDILLEAAGPALKSGRFRLDILGDGPMRPALEAQVREQGLGDAVTFHGMVPHTQVQTIATRANLLTFPSIREFGGGVVLEAMVLGLVPLIVDYAGPGELVGDGLGYKVPIGTRAEIVARFRDRLETILDAPGELPGIAARARAHALEHFTWPAKAAQVARIYDWVLAGRPAPVPDLFRRPADLAVGPGTQ